MRLRNVILGVAAVALVAAGFGVYTLVISLDEIVRTAIEDYGSEIMGTSVRVSSVSLQLREGKGAIRGLRVANPDGFPPGDSISLGEITLGIDVGSLTARDPIVIAVIDVVEPSVSLVTDARGRTSLQALRDNAARYSGGGGGATAESEEQSEGPPTRLAIRKLAVEGGLIAADLKALGGKRVEAKLPPLRLSNLGGDAGGTPGEIGATVARAFVKNCLTAVARSQIDDQLDGLLDDKLGGSAGQAAKGVVRGLLGE